MQIPKKDIHIRKKLAKVLRSRNIRARIAKRRLKNKIVRGTGFCSIGICILFLLYILFNVMSNCYYAFMKVEVLVPIELVEGENYRAMINAGINKILPKGTEDIISKSSAWSIADLVHNNTELIGTNTELWLLASSSFSKIVKHNHNSETKDTLDSIGRIRTSFNFNVFRHSDSRHPEYAGILAALIGSLFTISICFTCAFPIGVLTGVYLEEFKFKNKTICSIIEISINNLSATPAIIFGVVGLYFYISLFGVPRSSALVGGLVLALMMLPIIVITTRQALSSIPREIKEAAFALGASKVQVILHHSLPLAFPGITTGAILAVSRVLAESAPLLMVGMAAFVAEAPQNILDPATVFPLQIYIWASNPNIEFAELNSVLMLVLFTILLLLNIITHIVRKRMHITNH